MDDSLSNGVMGLDLNEDPRELLPNYQDLIDQLEYTQSRIHDRIRQLGEVIERARDLRHQARSSRELMYPFVRSFLQIARNMGQEGGDSSRVGDVDVMERDYENERKYERNSNQLVARALAIDPEIKKADTERGNFYDCNCCLEMAKHPVLTCCGHLFCWECFYMLPHQDSTSKECPVCMGEVSDNSIVPIYGNGNDCGAFKNKSIFKVPPRPKAQRIESSRQLRVPQGLSVPVSEALLRIRTSIGAIGGHFLEIPRLENSNYNAGSRNAQILQTNGLPHPSHYQGLIVSSENPSSLSDISTALTDAEGIVDESETYIGARELQNRNSLSSDYHDPLTVNDAVVQTANESLNSTGFAPSGRISVVVDSSFQRGEDLANGTSSLTNSLQLHSSLPSRRRSARLLDADRGSSHQSSRRRLN